MMSWIGANKFWTDYPEARRVFSPGDKEPAVGELFRNPDVAHALRLVAEQGESAYYKGTIAQAILSTSSKLSGTMNAADLAEYSAEWVEPISIQYRDWTVYELPPNGDGMAALEMLNIMEQFKPHPAGPHSDGELHTRIEAMKLAYADVKAYDGDPRFSKIPVDTLLSKEFAARRAKLIDPAKANCDVAPGALGTSDTTYVSR
jgi:gamma-glutamyltranspeptidase/glutathione hydrolase